MESTPYVVYHTSTPVVLAIDPACQSDPFYRYKMKQLTIQTIGNGKMIRTSFNNLDEVAKALKVPPSYIPHYLAKAIGAQAKYDQNKPAMQRGSISGEHGTKELSGYLVRFIREFVLCGKCKLPELEYVAKKNDLEMRCHGCGWKGTVSGIANMNEKFKRYVYTHPPPRREDTKRPARGGTVPVETNGKSGGKKRSTKPGAADSGVVDDDGVVWLSDTSEQAMEQRKETMVPDRLKDLVAVEGENVVEEPEAPAKPKAEEVLKAFLAKSPAPSTTDLINEVNRLVSEYTLDGKGCALLIFDALLADLVNLKDKVKPYKDVLIRCIGTDIVPQLAVLNAIEKKFAAEKNAKLKEEFLTKKAIFAFKELYDEDVIDEEAFLDWYLPEGANEKKLDPLRKAVQPFCKWLEEAEEESDDDGEEGDDDEEDGAENGKEAPAATTKTTPPPAEEAALDDEIDAL